MADYSEHLIAAEKCAKTYQAAALSHLWREAAAAAVAMIEHAEQMALIANREGE